MVYNQTEIAKLSNSDWERLIGKSLKITFIETKPLEGYPNPKAVLTATLLLIIPATNPPHLPIGLKVLDLKQNCNVMINLFQIKYLELD